jgi:hypothetical protein
MNRRAQSMNNMQEEHQITSMKRLEQKIIIVQKGEHDVAPLCVWSSSLLNDWERDIKFLSHPAKLYL